MVKPRKYNSTLKHIERTILKEEMNNLVKGKRIIIALLRHRYVDYELIGYLKKVRELEKY